MRGRRSPTADLAWVALAALAPVLAEAREIRVASTTRPLVLERIGAQPDALAVAFDSSGTRAAVGLVLPGKEPRSIVRLFAVDRPEALDVPVAGVVRALSWPADSAGVFAIVHRPARRGPGETHLVLVDPQELRARALRLLPASASGLDVWTAAGALVIAAEDEIRSFVLDGLRSGPLFRVPGPNLAVASLAASNLVLIGQAADLLLVDLADPPGWEAMPVRERLTLPAAARALAASPDGSEALVALEDGRTLSIALGPLRIDRDLGVDAIVATAGRRAEVAPIPVAPLPSPTPAPAPEPTPGLEPTPVPPAAASPPAFLSPSPAPSPSPLPSPPPALVVASEVPSEVPVADPPRPRPSLGGHVAGPAAASVAWVVVLGPSSLLREAARVPLDATGRWRVEQLAPGRYRVQLDGGSAGTLVSEPAFVVVEVEAEPVECAEIRATALVHP